MMKKSILLLASILLFTIGCTQQSTKSYKVEGKQSKIIEAMIEAVNEKDAEKYVAGFADSVKVFVDSELKVNGKENLKNNRANHFKNHPDVRSEIQHLVEIDDKVIMHDKVWLRKSDKVGQDIVEVFTFTDGKVSRMDVIQPKDLFQK